MKIAYAHCDIPCGIYDPTAARLAAATVKRMADKIKELPEHGRDTEQNANFVRMVAVKEEHSQICKKELLILWTDYFKPEHFEQYPNLTDMILAACKLCSQNKQHIDVSLAEDLVKAVDGIAKIFEETKKA